MSLGWWGKLDQDASRSLVHAALDEGINFFDTADVYSGGEAEEYLGAALAHHRDEVVIATKFHFTMGFGSDVPTQGGNSRRWIMMAVERSLRRLNTDRIDLYQVHRPDDSADIGETLSALSDLVHAGKVRMIGTSTFPAEKIVEAQHVSTARGFEYFRSDQAPYSILTRGVEASVLPVCSQYGVAGLAWSPLGGGWLTGKWQKEEDIPLDRGGRDHARFDPSLPKNAEKLRKVQELLAIARAAGIPLSQLALAFVLSHPVISSAIVGPTSAGELADCAAASKIVLDDDVLDRIDEVIEPGSTVNPADSGYVPAGLRDKRLRRRTPRGR
jgi:aryl-alcohol dehydrogenase-like predicted oxidoreductase